MKTWSMPAAVAQNFAANEYISACTATIDCNVQLPGEEYWKYIIDFGKVIPTAIGDRQRLGYVPCGKVHDLENDGELMPVTIYSARLNDGTEVVLDEPVECYFWAEMDAEGVLQDGHMTMSREGIVTNKS